MTIDETVRAGQQSSTESDALREPTSEPETVTAGTRTANWTRAGRNNWRQTYRNILIVADAIVIALTLTATQLFWLGDNPDLRFVTAHPFSVSYAMVSVVVGILWLIALGMRGTWSDRVFGVGTTEYVRVADASFRVFGVIAIAAFLAMAQLSRGYFLLALPAGVLALIAERWAIRRWLHSKRRRKEYCARVLLVGSEESVREIAADLARAPEAGYLVVGACVPTGKVGQAVPGTNIIIAGSLAQAEEAVSRTNADTVAVTSTDRLRPGRVKEISWSLKPGEQHLVLAPSITDIAGPRITSRPVAGLPLLHVETPRFTGLQRFSKRTFDIVVGTLCVALLSPVLLVVSLLVKFGSRGPLLYKQERIGRGGQPFGMLKFRSMRVGADAELQQLLEAQGTEKTPLFKIKDDPRITPVGKVLRKYSLDELPQLFNVLGGSMSLVGPRPQIAEEVALYTDAAHRRLLTRPGVTGLWQISGRSELSWEDAVRLDLYYVENWSLFGDIAILAKTGRAVVMPGETAH